MLRAHTPDAFSSFCSSFFEYTPVIRSNLQSISHLRAGSSLPKITPSSTLAYARVENSSIIYGKSETTAAGSPPTTHHHPSAHSCCPDTLRGGAQTHRILPRQHRPSPPESTKHLLLASLPVVCQVDQVDQEGIFLQAFQHRTAALYIHTAGKPPR